MITLQEGRLLSKPPMYIHMLSLGFGASVSPWRKLYRSICAAGLASRALRSFQTTMFLMSSQQPAWQWQKHKLYAN